MELSHILRTASHVAFNILYICERLHHEVMQVTSRHHTKQGKWTNSKNRHRRGRTQEAERT